MDLGSSGAKAAIIKEDGSISALAFEEYRFSNPQPFWSEIDPNLVWEKACKAIKDLRKKSGIDTRKYKLIVYILSGLLCGFTGVVLTSRLGSGQPATGESLMLDSVAAVILGGASLSGGLGTVTGTIIGVLIIGIMSNGLTLIGATYYTQEILKGIMLILAVLLNALRSNKR